MISPQIHILTESDLQEIKRASYREGRENALKDIGEDNPQPCVEVSRESLECAKNLIGAAREAAVWRLAERLHWKMDCLDPTGEPSWCALTPVQRELYRRCVTALLQDQDNIREAMRSYEERNEYKSN